MSTVAAEKQVRCEVVILGEDQVSIPGWVVDLESFRRWAETDAFPKDGRIDYLNGRVTLDMSKEQVFTHVVVKNEFNYVLTGLSKKEQRGLYLPDGLRLTNLTADLSGKPDGTFILNDSFDSGRVRLIEGREEGFVELEGIADMVLEIISRSSLHKDTVLLREAYWEAGIPEYWLVDVRQEPLRFDILRHAPKGYVAVRKQAGWVKSTVFGKAFHLPQRTNQRGHQEYTLAVR